MPAIPKRPLGPNGDRLQADANRAIRELEGEVDAYTPADAASWASPPPRSLREAVDRLAAAHAAAHPGSEP